MCRHGVRWPPSSRSLKCCRRLDPPHLPSSWSTRRPALLLVVVGSAVALATTSCAKSDRRGLRSRRRCAGPGARTTQSQVDGATPRPRSLDEPTVNASDGRLAIPVRRRSSLLQCLASDRSTSVERPPSLRRVRSADETAAGNARSRSTLSSEQPAESIAAGARDRRSFLQYEVNERTTSVEKPPSLRRIRTDEDAVTGDDATTRLPSSYDEAAAIEKLAGTRLPASAGRHGPCHSRQPILPVAHQSKARAERLPSTRKGEAGGDVEPDGRHSRSGKRRPLAKPIAATLAKPKAPATLRSRSGAQRQDAAQLTTQEPWLDGIAQGSSQGTAPPSASSVGRDQLRGGSRRIVRL